MPKHSDDEEVTVTITATKRALKTVIALNALGAAELAGTVAVNSLIMLAVIRAEGHKPGQLAAGVLQHIMRAVDPEAEKIAREFARTTTGKDPVSGERVNSEN